jgi:hypothetical protein
MADNQFDSAVERYLNSYQRILDPINTRYQNIMDEAHKLTCDIANLITEGVEDDRCYLKSAIHGSRSANGAILTLKWKGYYKYSDDEENFSERSIHLNWGNLAHRSDLIFGNLKRFANPSDQIDQNIQHIIAYSYDTSSLAQDYDLSFSPDMTPLCNPSDTNILQQFSEYKLNMSFLSHEIANLNNERTVQSKNNIRNQEWDPILINDPEGNIFKFMVFDREVHICNWNTEDDKPSFIQHPSDAPKTDLMHTYVYQNMEPIIQHTYLRMLGEHECETKGQQNRKDVCLFLMEGGTKCIRS